MDKYSVPKKINRHVLKALYYKNGTGSKTSYFSEIVSLVKVSMRNTTPVRDLRSTVRQSLQNMAQLGIICKSGKTFYVRDLKSSPVFPRRIKSKIFGLNNRRDVDSKSKLDPNMRKRVASDDSQSDCDIRKKQKRFRSSRKIQRKGHRVALPKARVSLVNLKLNTDIELDGNLSETNSGAEDGSENTSDVNILLKNRFFSEISDNEKQEDSEEKQNTKQDQDSQTSQNTNDKPGSEQTQVTNDEQDRATTPKTDPNSNIVSTAEQKADETTEQESNSAQNP